MPVRGRALAAWSGRLASGHRHRRRAFERELDAPLRDHAEGEAPGGLERTCGFGLEACWRRLPVAIEVLVEVVGIAEEDVVGVQLIGLATEAADRLQPVDEVRLG